MIYLYHHHDLGELALLLEVLMERAPPERPLAPETVVVPDRGRERWLRKTLAERLGVAANLHCPLPATFIWRDLLGERLGWSGHEAYLRDRLLWHLYRLLPALRRESAPVDRYLDGPSPEVHRLQLAERLADVFDQYQVFRGDLLTAWEAGREDPGSATASWQAPVWRRLVAELGPDHRVRTLRRAAEGLASGTTPVELPSGRLFCFGITEMPPDYLRLLYALGQQVDVHLLVPNPAEAYWGDIQSRPVSLDFPVADSEPPSQEALESGHPLLASMARPMRDFIHLLYAEELSAIREPELGEVLPYTPPEGDRLLARIQRGVMALDPAQGAGPVAEDDDSVQLHACHGPLREVQVLHDQLLDLLGRHDDLHPREIVVMMPDVAAYAPAIRSVFGAAGGRRHIPWSLADQPRRSSHPMVQTFLDVLDLPLARWSASHLMTLAAVPAIMRRFGLDEAALAGLRHWVADAGIRWGRDAANRQRHGAGAYDAFTWSFGLDRLLLGSALDEEEVLVDDVAPCGQVEGRDAETVGRLHHLVETLTRWQETLEASHTPRQWQELGHALIDDLFAIDPDDPGEDAALEALREALGVLEDAHECMPDTALSWEALREKLHRTLEQAGGRQPLLTGGVTFCALGSLTGVPAQVVCLLGMDDAAFPRQDGGRSFNLILQRRALGDRSNRDADRQAFLEALLAARDVFYISYTGTEVRSGEPLHPAAPVGELLDFLDRHLLAGSGTTARARLVTQQPMQPFSRAYFDEGRPPRVFTFREEWQAGGRATAQPEAALPPFDDGHRARAPDEEVVELAALRRFLRDPPGVFLRDGLGLADDEDETALEDDEPFVLSGLAGWQLRSQLLDHLRATDERLPEDNPPRLWLRRGLLPPMPMGAAAWQPEAAAVNALAPFVARWEADTAPVDVDVTLPGGARLVGRIADARTDGLRRVHAGGLKLRRALMDWVDYLALLAQGHLEDGASLWLAGADSKNGEPAVQQAEARADEAPALLADLLAVHREGLTRPLPLHPDLVEHYLKAEAKRLKKELDEPTAAREALEECNRNLRPDQHPDQRPHYVDKPGLRAALGPAPAYLGAEAADSDFVDRVSRVHGPLFQRLEAWTAAEALDDSPEDSPGHRGGNP